MEAVVSSNPEFVTSLARGLSVIRAFDEDHRALTLADVARRADIPRAAARRFLHTLCALGYVSFDGKRFRLTARVLGLGFAYLSSSPLWDAAQPFMEQVSEEVNESCSMSVLDGTEIVYVARVPTKRIMSVALSIGTRLPAHATSMGRVLLGALDDDARAAYFAAAKREAFTLRTVTEESALRDILDTVSRDDYALVDQELEIGVRSIAVPVRGRGGRVLSALNASGHAARVSAQDMVRDFLPPLRRAADSISAAIPG